MNRRLLVLVIGHWTLVIGHYVSVVQAQSRPGVVVPVSGERFTGRLASIEKDGKLTFSVGDERRTLASQDLVWFGSWTHGEKGPLVVLADGGSLVIGSLDA